MSQDSYINVTAGSARDPNSGQYNHTVVFGSAGAGDLTFSYDHTKFTTKAALVSAIQQILTSLGQISNLKP